MYIYIYLHKFIHIYINEYTDLVDEHTDLGDDMVTAAAVERLTAFCVEYRSFLFISNTVFCLYVYTYTYNFK
jgi:hypothetical protein